MQSFIPGVILGFFAGLVWIRLELFPIKWLKKYKRVLSQSNQSSIKTSDFDNLRDQFRSIHPQHSSVVFGDSIIQLGMWEELIPQLQIHNRGISGDRSVDCLNRIKDVLELSPKKCIIYIGINDVIHNISIQETIKNLEKIVMILKGNDVKVYLLELFNAGEYKIPGFSQHISQLNEEYSDLAQTLKINFLRIGGSDSQIKFLNTDGIHLNGKGYSTLAKIILHALD